MRWHAISIIAACATIALAGFFVFHPDHDDKGSRRPRAGLIGNQCAATPDNGEIPTEYSCEKP
jgi:hypothetical protein